MEQRLAQEALFEEVAELDLENGEKRGGKIAHLIFSVNFLSFFVRLLLFLPSLMTCLCSSMHVEHLSN